MGSVEELPPSKLGTQDYWDGVYDQEIQNFNDNHDEGEIWFGEKHMLKVLKWIKDKKISKSSSILDIGCGNGVFLSKLCDEGFTNLYGIDYSSNAVTLATKIALTNKHNITFQACDFLNVSTIIENTQLSNEYDLCHDKGTYDAISLRPDNAKLGRQEYIISLKHILKDDGLFIITSCNWTLDDLKQHFTQDFDFIDYIPAPTFQFGGHTGSTVSCAIFKKVLQPG